MKHEVIKTRMGEVAIPKPETYKDCVELIRSDYYRYHGKCDSIIKMLLYGLKNPPFMLTFWLRLAQIHGLLYWPAKIIHRHYSQKFGLQIFPSMKIGYGLWLGHSISVVINPATVIGNNVNIHQLTQIGTSTPKAAIIGNNVCLNPMISLVNDVHIGNNATIGTGAVVTHDVPLNATVVGVPARVIHSNQPGRYIGNRWPIPS